MCLPPGKSNATVRALPLIKSSPSKAVAPGAGVRPCGASPLPFFYFLALDMDILDYKSAINISYVELVDVS
jgi:hypothetical protein